jgi:Zn-dependent protease
MLFAGRYGIFDLVTLIPAILLSLTVHEFAHAWVAWKMGDNTPKELGRLSLNPFAHLDIMGTIVMIVTGYIGWAKPVPIDPRNFKNGLKDMSLVALAGPMSNIILAIFFIIALLLIYKTPFIVSIVPMDIITPIVIFLFSCLYLNIAFAFFNLLPIPPLDGFNIISSFLPVKTVVFLLRYRLIFMIALILFIWKGPFYPIMVKIGKFIYNFISYN